MKFKITLLILTFFSFRVFAQSNKISLLYGVSNNAVDINGASNSYTYQSQNAVMFGITYTKQFTRLFSLETGFINYSNKVLLTSATGMHTSNTINVLSIPVYAKFNLFRYGYVYAGLSANTQTNYSDNSNFINQGGFAAELGFGGHYTIKNFDIFITPFLREYEIFYLGNDLNTKLTQLGLRFGAGYSF